MKARRMSRTRLPNLLPLLTQVLHHQIVPLSVGPKTWTGCYANFVPTRHNLRHIRNTST